MKILRALTTSFIVSSMFLFGSLLSYGYTTVNDTFTINFDSSGSNDVPYTGHYAGNNEYSYNITTDPNTSATFTVNVTSITGDPQMQIVMFDPTGTSYWAASNLVDLAVGENTISWGPFDASVQLRYMIKVDSDDAVTFDSFVAADGSGSTGGNSGGSGDSGTGVSISDAFTIDFDNGVTGTTEVAYSGHHEGENQFNYSMDVSSGGSVTFTVNATSVTGDPRMQILMFNPDNNSEFWAASDPADIVSGSNTLSWGPFDANVHLKFTILVDSDDAVGFDSFVVSSADGSGGGDASGSISITDTVTIDFDDGVTGTTDVAYTGHHADENQYAYSITVESGSSVTFSLNATSVTGDPRMQILMFNPDNNSEYWAASDSADIVSGNNTLSWGPFDASVHLKFTILLDADDSVTFDTYNVTDSGDSSTGGPTVNNGIRFRFEEVSGGSAAYSFETDAVEVSGETPQTYSITIPAYSDAAATFEAIVLKAIGDNQSIAVNDVTLTIDGVSYGGSGNDSLVFDVPFGGVSYDNNNNDGHIYTYLETSESWGGFLQDQAQASAVLPANGVVFENAATITFSANLVNTAVNLPPLYDGETAFSNGAIDTSEDTGSGRDSDPPYRWSAYVSWFTLEAGDTQGTWLGGDNWDRLSNLPATWDNGVITLSPNTGSYDTWSEEGSDDGIHFLEQTLKIEGTRATSAVLGNTVNFSGTVDSNTLNSRYTVTAFIKALDPNNNYTPIIEEQVTLTSSGNFAISADLPAGDYIPQIGFLLTGRNANPATDWGNIQISNVSASYGGTSSIPEGNFTNGSNGYWQAVTGVEFNNAGGNGSIPGQVVMTNTGTTRSNVYIASNTNVPQSIADFGMSAGTTYDVSYYMNRISGSDLGLVQFAFNVNGAWVYVPSDTTGNIHSSSVDNGSWAQYSQEIEVPENTTEAVLYVISGAQSVIAFDQINATAQVSTNDFASWASDNGLSGSDASFSSDPDNDGIPNGLESFLGTSPSQSSSGMSNITKTSNGVTMQHSHNSNLADDVSATYEWSTDLSSWNASGASADGTTVTITTDNSGGTTTATATVEGTNQDDIFIKLSVSNE